MSCITKILEIKGSKEYILATDGVVIEGGGIYKDYEYIITFNDMGFRCGYVALDPDHLLYDKDCTSVYKESDPSYVTAHGGITFHDTHSIVKKILGYECLDKWLGFDAGHCYDLVDLKSVHKYFPNLREAKKDYVLEMAKLFERDREIKIRTFSYMEDECKQLIDQLLEVKICS